MTRRAENAIAINGILMRPVRRSEMEGTERVVFVEMMVYAMAPPIAKTTPKKSVNRTAWVDKSQPRTTIMHVLTCPTTIN